MLTISPFLMIDDNTQKLKRVKQERLMRKTGKHKEHEGSNRIHRHVIEEQHAQESNIHVHELEANKDTTIKSWHL